MRYKYPRTPHLPWSPGATSDDVYLNSMAAFVGREVVITEKMDGENTSIYQDHSHARSIDSGYHPSRNYVKVLQAQIGYLLPEGWRVCGENVFAKHSIEYADLPAYFMAFSLWNENNVCLSWEETMQWFSRLDLATPKVLYQGIYDEDLIRTLRLDLTKQEGYVVRLASEFQYNRFADSVGKWVRKDHVQTGKHWMFDDLVANQLRDHSDD